MAKYQSANNRTIEKAFKRFQKRVDTSMIEGMKQLLDEAVQFALDNHDSAHHFHLEMGDTYGWILVHDGKVVAKKAIASGNATENLIDKFYEAVTDDDPNKSGRASSQLSRLAKEVQGGEYVGIVMAGMVNAPTYFSVRFETAVLRDTMDNIRSNFPKYFKKIEK